MLNRTTFPRRSRSGIGILACFVALTICGCESTNAPVTADPNAAKTLLESTLNAWKDGKTVAALKDASPSVIVADPSWEKGAKLVKYTIDSDGKQSGAEREFTVSLYFDDEKTKDKDKPQQVAYKVGTNPINTVFRAMF